jgi:hypothetical protein
LNSTFFSFTFFLCLDGFNLQITGLKEVGMLPRRKASPPVPDLFLCAQINGIALRLSRQIFRDDRGFEEYLLFTRKAECSSAHTPLGNERKIRSPGKAKLLAENPRISSTVELMVAAAEA